ncbi:MAG: hypothetical protein ACJAUC_002020, partial [Planctomycetota bacterium]
RGSREASKLASRLLGVQAHRVGSALEMTVR